VNLGKWLLVNLFSSFVSAEMQRQDANDSTDDEHPSIQQTGKINDHDDVDGHNSQQKRNLVLSTAPRFDRTESTATAASIQLERASIPTPPPVTALKIPLTAITTNTDSSPFHPTDSNSYPTSDSTQRGPMTAPPTTGRSFDYFSGSHHPVNNHSSVVQPPPPAALSSSPVSPNNSNFMHRLKNLSVKAKLGKGPNNEDRPNGYATEDDKQTIYTTTSVNGDVSIHSEGKERDEDR
jgi:WD repeat-containing protein 48